MGYTEREAWCDCAAGIDPGVLYAITEAPGRAGGLAYHPRTLMVDLAGSLGGALAALPAAARCAQPPLGALLLQGTAAAAAAIRFAACATAPIPIPYCARALRIGPASPLVSRSACPPPPRPPPPAARRQACPSAPTPASRWARRR